MSRKRIQKEIENFPKNMEEYNLKYKIVLLDAPTSHAISTTIHLGILDKNTNLIIKLYCSHDYPFKSPEVLVYNNNKNSFMKFDRWSAHISQNINKQKKSDKYISLMFSIISKPILNRLWKYDPTSNNCICLCCESITCSNKWGPGLKLSNILFEYITLRDYSVYTSKLMQRLIMRLFNNERWVMPDDIILHIIQLCDFNSFM